MRRVFVIFLIVLLVVISGFSQTDGYKGQLSCYSGAWIPAGEISKLGIHPEFGLQFASKKKKISYELSIGFKFLNTPNIYNAIRTTKIEETKHFRGSYMGFGIGRDIIKKSGHELQLLAGIALDGIEVLKNNSLSGNNAKSTWTYNINFGLGYKYYFSKKYLIGFRAKYNIVDYTLNNVIDLKGNTITIQVLFGLLIKE
ncbi:hypothetical protein ACFLTI_06280 [Bacteroidota bacterium]